MFEIIRSGTKIDFVGKRVLWGGISIVGMLLTVLLVFTKGINYGIDFTGGAEIEVAVPAAWEIGKVRETLEKGGIKESKVQQIGEANEHQFLIRVQGAEKELQAVSGKVSEVITHAITAENLKGFEVLRTSVVGPAAGESLKESGLLSMIYALLCILVYVTVRFDSRYSPGAVLALFHDSVITLGVLILFGVPFDLQILAAMLALIGYSNNDTIIVYDRVRETLLLNPKLSIEAAVNQSINETLGRTILTSLSTFLSVAALFVWGGKVIEGFAFTLMVGIVVGTYSSIFIASSIVIFITKYQEKRELDAKVHGRPSASKV
jgi:preprotein translocase subunit SecF